MYSKYTSILCTFVGTRTSYHWSEIVILTYPYNAQSTSTFVSADDKQSWVHHSTAGGGASMERRAHLCVEKRQTTLHTSSSSGRPLHCLFIHFHFLFLTQGSSEHWTRALDESSNIILNSSLWECGKLKLTSLSFKVAPLSYHTVYMGNSKSYEIR